METLKNSLKIKTPERALVQLMDMCARSEKASGDARRLLARWGVEKPEAEKIMEKLLREGFIDDLRYAQMYVREKVRLSKWGVFKIKAALRAKQVAPEIITQAMEQVDASHMESKLEDQLQRKMKGLKYKNSYDLRGKLLRYGMGLGFEYEDVTSAIDQIVKSRDDENEFE